MTSLPTVGNSTNSWGSILNDWLTKMPFFNVVAYGADPTGATDSTTAIVAARSAANAAGGGIVFWPAGTYLTGNQILYSLVIDLGAGPGLTIVKLINGANTDLFSGLTGSINLAAASQASSNTAITNFGFVNMTLDGNRVNQSGGPSYPIRAYGHRHILEHVEIKNGYSGGILMDYNGTPNPSSPNNAFMPRWYDVMIHDCNGICLEMGGPTDMQWSGVNAYASGSHVVHIAPNCVALRMNQCHFWATPVGNSSTTLLNEAPELVLTSCQVEGSDTCALVLLANDCQASNLELGSTADATRQGRGMQLGQQAGQTPYSGQIYQSAGLTSAASCNICQISGKIYDCNAGAVDERNASGNVYYLNVYQTSGTAISTNGGYLAASSSGNIKVTGLTADGTQGKGGVFQIGTNNSFNAFTFYNPTGNQIFNIDSRDGAVSTYRGVTLGLYTDGGSTFANFFQNNASGQIWFGNAFDTYIQESGGGIVQVGNAVKVGGGSVLYSGSGAPSNGNGSNGDYYFRTDTPGTANQRIYVKSSGSWVGIL